MNSFLDLLPVGRETPLGLPRKVLFGGERIGGISSYLAGWMAGGGIDVIVLDGANGFDPYRVSSFARKALIPPERLLKKIRIARAFTCYQMATLVRRNSRLPCSKPMPGFPEHPESHGSSFSGWSPPFWTKMCLKEKSGLSSRGL